MQIIINFTKKHFYLLATIVALITGLALVGAYGTSDPAFFGHSASELIINDSSISGTISGSKIDVSTLSGTASSLSVGSASSASSASSSSGTSFTIGSQYVLDIEGGHILIDTTSNGHIASFEYNSGGRVGINCQGGGNHNLQVMPGSGASCQDSGSWMDGGDTTFTVGSSRTYKENITQVYVEDILGIMRQIPVNTFDFKNGSKNKMGLIAEDFYKVFGRGSDKNINGYEVTMALWLAVQELDRLNQEREEENERLRAALCDHFPEEEFC